MQNQMGQQATNKQNLSEKELGAIEDQMSQEQILIQKYKNYAQECTDPELKTKCEQIASKHQQHFNTLLNNLN